MDVGMPLVYALGGASALLISGSIALAAMKKRDEPNTASQTPAPVQETSTSANSNLKARAENSRQRREAMERHPSSRHTEDYTSLAASTAMLGAAAGMGNDYASSSSGDASCDTGSYDSGSSYCDTSSSSSFDGGSSGGFDGGGFSGGFDGGASVSF